MRRVVVDRDSVSVADDADSHCVLWEFDVNFTIAEVMLRMISEKFLPPMATDHSWTVMYVGGAVVSYPAHGQPRLEYIDGGLYPFCTIFVRADGTTDSEKYRFGMATQGNPYSAGHLRSPNVATGEYAFMVKFHANGGVTSLEQLRETVEADGAVVQADMLAMRAMRLPDIYGPDGMPHKR